MLHNRLWLRHNKNLLLLHATVFVWGFTGILGELISINATLLVWYRVLIASSSLFVWFKLSKTTYKTDKRILAKLIFTGSILAVHWILFFYSIKQSTVSVTLVCLSSITLFTAILEPLTSRKKIQAIEIIVGLMIITGIYLIFEFESQYTLGIITGLLSALCASSFSIINSKLIKHTTAPIISFYELLGAFLWITLYLLLADVASIIRTVPGTQDSIYLLLLGTICTSVAYVAGVSVMKELSAFRVALITNLEPIYGIMLAFVILGKSEQMSLGFYSGALIILSSIFLYPVIKDRANRGK